MSATASPTGSPPAPPAHRPGGWHPSPRALAELRRQGVRPSLLAETISPVRP